MIAVEVRANGPDFDCKRCRWGRHCDASNPAPFAQWVIEGVLESKTCLLPMVTESSWWLLSLHMHYRRRVLPHGGGILDQPNYYREAMEVIDAAERRTGKPEISDEY